MSEPTTPSRRAVVAGLAVAGGAGLDLVPYMRPARAAVHDHSRIEAAVRDVQATTEAFEAALAQFEASPPALHPDLIWRRGGRLPHSLTAIERLPDGRVADRGINLQGQPSDRYIALPRLIESEIAYPTMYGGKGWRRFLKQTLKRARRYRARLACAEDPVIDAEEPMLEARRRLDELASEIMAMPSTTQADIALKARALVAFLAVDDQTWRRYQAGTWGAQLAGEILVLPRHTA